MRTTTKTRTKRIGSSAVVLLLLAAGAENAWSGSKKDRKQVSEETGIVAGTVFRDPGFAVPGAGVTLEESRQPGDSPSWMKKPLKTQCNGRGEFAFRVPPVEMHYVVRAKAKGLVPDEKQAEIRGDERVDVTFLLTEESKK